MTHSSRTSLRYLVSFAALSAGLAVPALASAQQPAPNANCPPGSWFCADTQQQPAAPAGQPVQPGGPLQPLPAPGAAPAQPAPGQPPPVVYQPAPPPPVVVYQPPPPVMVVKPEAAPPPPYYYSPRTVRRSEWGLNLHLEGAMIGKGTGGDASMGGGGVGLRYRARPEFAVEANVDFVGGTDYNSNHRNETAFTFNGLLFLNPKSAGQVYILGGIGWSGAHVTNTSASPGDFGPRSLDTNYAYFGAQVGIGLELRLSRHFALNGDIRGFIRGRIDDQAQYNQEFTDSNGRSTNTSGGGLLTLGATFYF